ncbi:hypothetical protein GCM10010260_72980 [Streptomyces filipinensis]|uniref:Transposase n=1 Tax=Streptomyces filipinensis TaxID=66887 RepID=A0A918MEM0_9ACTN|nr:hypothetical protein [Streptomyces filipinensis]GGV22158.1 hypothetical protein GCM10010260_72980 [Streptomyces filipinensis]
MQQGCDALALRRARRTAVGQRGLPQRAQGQTATTHIADPLRLGKMRWRIEHDCRELQHGLGLHHFEGRTSRGWLLAPPRHGTVTVAAVRLWLRS